jgi:peptidoglycan/LPS O-acetylase OafA/YrhL
MSQLKQHFTALEWLRFGLGLYIVFFHTFHFPGLPEWVTKSTQLGFFATSTFFVLSGFLLSHVYLVRKVDHSVKMRESTRSFLVKRFANLYPIHIFSLLATLVIVSALPLFLIKPDDAGASLRFVVFDVNNYANGHALRHYMNNAELIIAFIMNFTLLQSLNPYYLTFNAPAWTVSTLFCLYLLFPFLSIRLSKLKNPLGAMMLINLIYLVPVLLVIGFTDFGYPETGILHRNPLVRLPEFAAGILLCSLYHRRSSVAKGLSRLMGISLAALIVLSLYGASHLLAIAPRISQSGNVPYYLLHNGALLPAQLALIYLCLFIRLPDNERFVRWSRRLGGASLPMFAFHVPIYIIYSRLQLVAAGSPGLCFTQFRECMTQAGPPLVAFYPVYLFIMIVFCLFFQERVVVVCRQKIIEILIGKAGLFGRKMPWVARS